MNETADRVRHERLKRGWSVRAAARAGNISNTYWGSFEAYHTPLSPTITEAVALAFGWPANWPDIVAMDNGTPASAAEQLDKLRSDLIRLRGAVLELALVTRQLAALANIRMDEEAIADAAKHDDPSWPPADRPAS